MSYEMIERVRKAYHYEKLAAKSLLGPRMSGHLDIIEHEVKELLVEAVCGAVEKGIKGMQKEEPGAGKEGKKTKKISIED